MEPLRLEIREHRGQRCLMICGRMTAAADRVVRGFSGRLFSRTHGCWYIPYSDAGRAQLAALLRQHQDVELSEENHAAAVQKPAPLPEGYHEKLVSVRYSPATISTYESQLRKFLEWLRPTGIEGLTEEIIGKYQLYLVKDHKVSNSTQNTAINAIKFYLEKVQRGERKVYYIDRPMKETKLPRVLSQEEMKALLGATKNIKHRCMLMMLYATGIRRSELLNLRWRDIDEERLQLFVDGGKGRKDRVTLVSRSVIAYTRYYMGIYKPKDYLFEGVGGGQYSARSLSKVIHRSARAAGLSKNVTAHVIRHSFATHLLEEGVDLRYIQVLMGHESSKTTERYTHVTTRGFSKIKSPLDRLGLDFLPTDGPTDKWNRDI